MLEQLRKGTFLERGDIQFTSIGNMEALENSYNKGIECELKLEKLSPERERAIQSKYNMMAQKFICDQEDMYSAKIFEIRTEKESVYINNEKHRIRIPREWGYENN